MKSIPFLFTISISLGIFASCCTKAPAPADDSNDTESNASAKADGYPLKVCVVSGEELGGMGEPYVHNHEGVTVKFCCKPCLKKFNKEPEVYLAKLER
jgi:YHS domain-containing protein